MSHLIFKEVPVAGKITKVWEILSCHNNSSLGLIKWNSGWRCYVFEPDFNCIWSWDCLKELSEFIKNEMDKRKAKQ
jgi:hypothetical protein